MAISRMQFLRGDFSGKNAALRPPWAVDEAAFTASCDRCGRCAEACSAGVIQAGRGGFPEIEFSRDECVFCGDCAAACETGALSKAARPDSPWDARLMLDRLACLAFMGVECRGCLDPCEVRAIRIPFRPGGIGTPVIDSQTCTGCGACVRVCPGQALSVRPGRS